MNTEFEEQPLSSPFSTGGGGTNFEYLVGASYLVWLLAGDMPRGLDQGTTRLVAFQQRYAGSLLDDIVVTSNDGTKDRRLALQVKYDLTFSAASSNTVFARVIDDCWKTFTGESGWVFNQDCDRLGIAVGVYNSKISKHYERVLNCARTSIDPSDFLRKVNTPYFASDEQREFLRTMKTLLEKSKGSALTDDELWNFLRCLVLLHFDLRVTSGRDYHSVICRSGDMIQSFDESDARTLFNSLVTLVAEYAAAAGVIDSNILRQRIGVRIKDQTCVAADLARLRKHGDRILNSIKDTIGGTLQLPRAVLVDQLESMIEEEKVVGVVGEPMVGKSVLLKFLANRLRSEGEVFVLSIERIGGETIESFFNSLGIDNSMKELLSAASSAPTRCVMIDGLERIVGEEDKTRIFGDIVREVQEYNDSVISNAGSEDNLWRIVFTCRQDMVVTVAEHLHFKEAYDISAIHQMTISSLDSEEVAEVVNVFPALREITSKRHLGELLERPLVLDILTKSCDLPTLDSMPDFLDETWLMLWFWKEVVRREEGLASGLRQAAARDQIMMLLAEQALEGHDSFLIGVDIDPDSQNGLMSDGILARDDTKVRFAHDVFRDWSMAMLLHHHKDSITKYLAYSGESLVLRRPFFLFASMLLLSERDTLQSWFRLVDQLSGDQDLSPWWLQTALKSVLVSPLIKEYLPKLESRLFANDQKLLIQLIKVLRLACVSPDPTVRTLFGDMLPESEIERFEAYLTVLQSEFWIPIMQLLVNKVDQLNDESILEFSHCAMKWMKATNDDDVLRRDFVKNSMILLNSKYLAGGLKSVLSSSLSYDDRDLLISNLIQTILWGADIEPEAVEDFVRSTFLTEREHINHIFEEAVFELGWVPLCRYLPEFVIDVFSSIICIEQEPGVFEGYHSLFMGLGISHTPWYPPTPIKGPFLGLLTLHPFEGIRLVETIVNHATRIFRQRERVQYGEELVPQNIRLGTKDIELWGDGRVYQWYRYPSLAPEAVACALMALEEWMNRQLHAGYNAEDLFEEVIVGAESVAIIGICVSVALKNYKTCIEASVPILENPIFWAMDVDRLVADLQAPTFIRMLPLMDEKDRKKLIDMATEPHRIWDIRSLVLPILLKGHEESSERLQTAMRGFADNPFHYYESELKNETLIQQRVETSKIWAAQGDRQNYEIIETNDDEMQFGLRFKMPAELEQQHALRLQEVSSIRRIYEFVSWSMSLLDNGAIEDSFSLEAAMQFAITLVEQDSPRTQPDSFLAESEQRARGLAAFAAGMTVRNWKWIENNNYQDWFKEQLLIAAVRPEPPSEFGDEEVSVFSEGYRRSASRGLPVLLAELPGNTDIKRAISELATNVNHQVRAFLFDGLKTLWDVDEKTIWKSVRRVIHCARIKAIHHKYWYLNKQYGASVDFGRHSRYQRFKKLAKRQAEVSTARLIRKPLRECSSNDIHMDTLMSILCCIPRDERIYQVRTAGHLFGLLTDFLGITINSFLEYRPDDDINKPNWQYSEWNTFFFDVLSNAILLLPQNDADNRLVEPILQNWETAPAMLARFLLAFGRYKGEQQFDDRFHSIWCGIGSKVLSTLARDELEFRIDDSVREILSSIIFVDSYDITPSTHSLDVVSEDYVALTAKWCEVVGYHPDCFPSLLRYLSQTGFGIFPKYGIDWLCSCISEANRDLLERSRNSASLALLLYDAWQAQSAAIHEDSERLKKFSFLVAKCSEKGESLAVGLQSKMQGLDTL